jgi:DNA-binding transcriptional regulator YiaG
MNSSGGGNLIVVPVASQTATERNVMSPNKLTRARKKLKLSPTEMAHAMGVPYDTYKNWQSGRRSMPAVAVRCVELLLKYPKTAKKLASV